MAEHTINERWAWESVAPSKDVGEHLGIIDVDPVLERRDQGPEVAHLLIGMSSVFDFPASPVVPGEAIFAIA